MVLGKITFDNSVRYIPKSEKAKDCVSVMRDVIRASHELRRNESKNAKLEELINNISERRYEVQANERAGKLGICYLPSEARLVANPKFTRKLMKYH